MKVAHLSAYLPYKVDFIPLSEIGKNKPDYFELRSLDLPMEMVNFGYESVKAIDDIKLILRPMKDDAPINTCYYHYVVYLLENSYDVFGLIEKGEAIDINTLK